MPMMKVQLSTLLALLVPPMALAAEGDVLWEDNFDAGALDTTYWSYDLGTSEFGWGNGELQEYTSSLDNVNVEDGLLKITAIRNDDGSGFTSGRVKTEDKMLFMYGRVEARIQVPNVADGLWPAFWTLGYNYADVGWPRSGEIDIMEIGQGLAITEGVVNSRIISGASWEHNEEWATYAGSLDTEYDFYTAFRNYTMDWTPERIATYVDGSKIWEMDITSAECTDCSEFHQPHFVLLNLGVGGGFTSVGGSGSSSAGASSSSSCGGSSSAGAVSSSSGSSGGCSYRTDVTATLPATMYVEYIKLYDNGYTELEVPVDNVFDPDEEDDGSVKVTFPTAMPSQTPSPPPYPTPMPTPPPTPQPVAGPTPQPTPAPSFAPVTFAPVTLIVDDPPTPVPTEVDVDIIDCRDAVVEASSKSGKSGKDGKDGRARGRGRRDRHRGRTRHLCETDIVDEGKSGKSGKSAKSTKSTGKDGAAATSTVTDSIVSRTSALSEGKDAGMSLWTRSPVLGVAGPLMFLLWNAL